MYKRYEREKKTSRNVSRQWRGGNNNNDNNDDNKNPKHFYPVDGRKVLFREMVFPGRLRCAVNVAYI